MFSTMAIVSSFLMAVFNLGVISRPNVENSEETMILKAHGDEF